MEPDNVSFFETSGFSMWPFIRPGERLVIKKVPVSGLKAGDIISYRSDHQLACHRLVRKVRTKEGYVLYARGDNSHSPPEPVTETMFSGKVIGILKNGRMISLTTFGQRLVNRLIVIIAPLIATANKAARPYYRNSHTHI